MPGRYEIALGIHSNPDEIITEDRAINVEITPKQRLFLQADTRGRIYCGGVGSGKEGGPECPTMI